MNNLKKIIIELSSMALDKRIFGADSTSLLRLVQITVIQDVHCILQSCISWLKSTCPQSGKKKEKKFKKKKKLLKSLKFEVIGVSSKSIMEGTEEVKGAT